MQTYLSKFLNEIFKYITIFALTFVWTNFYIKKMWLSLLLALLITIFVGLILRYLTNKKSNIIKLKNNEKKLMEECSYQFLFAEEKVIKNFFVNLLKTKYTVELKENFIIVKNNEKRTLFVPCYASTSLEAKDVIQAYITAKKFNINNVIMTCKKLSEESVEVANSVKDMTFSLLNEEQTFAIILKPFNVYPNFSIELKNVEKLKYKDIKKIAFNKSKTKGYFLSGLLLLFSSFFTPYNLYYVIMASILFLLSLYSAFNTTNNKIKNKDIF